jgi:hypothetical protein
MIDVLKGTQQSVDSNRLVFDLPSLVPELRFYTFRARFSFQAASCSVQGTFRISLKQLKLNDDQG